MTQDKTVNMSPWAWILDLLKKQGLSFVLLGVAVWYFYGEVRRLEEKADLCQNRIIELYQNVIIRNTHTLEDVSWYLEELHSNKQKNKQ
jgi:hypothetical protein